MEPQLAARTSRLEGLIALVLCALAVCGALYVSNAEFAAQVNALVPGLH